MTKICSQSAISSELASNFCQKGQKFLDYQTIEFTTVEECGSLLEPCFQWYIGSRLGQFCVQEWDMAPKSWTLSCIFCLFDLFPHDMTICGGPSSGDQSGE